MKMIPAVTQGIKRVMVGRGDTAPGFVAISIGFTTPNQHVVLEMSPGQTAHLVHLLQLMGMPELPGETLPEPVSEWGEVFGTHECRVLMRGSGPLADTARRLARQLVAWADALENKTTSTPERTE